MVYEGVRYNCSVFCYDGRILLIRPKLYLANDGNYRELRWFSAWKKPQKLEELQLPCMISKEISQLRVPFGDACLSLADTYNYNPPYFNFHEKFEVSNYIVLKIEISCWFEPF